MPPLRRHQLAYLGAEGWAQVLRQPWDDEARSCLCHWAGRHLPLVVTRQPLPAEAAGTSIALGLPAPLQWSRRRLALQVPLPHIGWFSEFPLLRCALSEATPDLRPRLQALSRSLADQGLHARAYGSMGWQQLTGLRYVHGGSDLDLWVGVGTVDDADHAVDALQRHAPGPLRLDGELVFPNGAAVAWREWAAWRAGRSRALLVKRLHGASLEHAPMPAAATWVEAA